MILLQANQIARYFGADTLFENIHLEVNSKARIGLVGRNGAGKSTLLKNYRCYRSSGCRTSDKK